KTEFLLTHNIPIVSFHWPANQHNAPSILRYHFSLLSPPGINIISFARNFLVCGWRIAYNRVLKLIGKDLLLLNRKQIAHFLFELKEKNTVKASTRNTYRAAMDKFYVFAVEQKLICENPMPKNFSDPIPDEEEKEALNQTHLEIAQRIINSDIEAEKLRYENNEISDRVYAKKLREPLALCFLIDLGIRVGSILKIFIDDLELDEDIRPYPGGVRELSSFVKVKASKNGRYRETSEPLDKATVDIIKEYLEVASADITIGKIPLIDVKDSRSIQIWCGNLKKRINDYIEKHEIQISFLKILTPHSFRRTIGTIFGQRNPAMAQKKLNHRDARSLMSYFYPSKEEKFAFRKNVLKPRPRPEAILG
ncbi:MAG: site-specific integrase, partial [bacterium]|nr:site-specific integrase [bacterium]